MCGVIEVDWLRTEGGLKYSLPTPNAATKLRTARDKKINVIKMVMTTTWFLLFRKKGD